MGKKSLVGALIGLAVGAGAGLLLSPHCGEKNRSIIKKETKKIVKKQKIGFLKLIKGKTPKIDFKKICNYSSFLNPCDDKSYLKNRG